MEQLTKEGYYDDNLSSPLTDNKLKQINNTIKQNNMKTAEDFLNEKYAHQADAKESKFGFYEVISIIDEFKKKYDQDLLTPTPSDMTEELLVDIISWEKDLSEYESLEAILREKYIINRNMSYLLTEPII